MQYHQGRLIDHVHLRVSGLEASKLFYRAVLTSLGFPDVVVEGQGFFYADKLFVDTADGNAYEWCRDWYHAKLPGGDDPDLSWVRGAMNRDGSFSRVRRGGAWTDDGWTCRSAFRARFEPERRSDHIGFRVVAVRT